MPDEKVIDDEALENALIGNDVDDDVNDDAGDDVNAEGDDADEVKPDDVADVEDKKDKTKEIDWEKELNDARSDWGRKQKKLEDQVKDLTSNVNSLVEALKQGHTNQQPSDSEYDFDQDDPIPLTMGGLLATLEKLNNKKNANFTNKQKQYEDKYLDTVDTLGSRYSEEVHKVIVDRMFKDFNVKHSDYPDLDAKLNYREAEAAILREIKSRKQNPLEKNKGKNVKGLGGGMDGEQDVRVATPVKLDKYAQDFIKSTGMKEEDAQKALRGGMPSYLRGKMAL